MSRVRSTAAIKIILAAGAVVLSLAISTGQLTAAGLPAGVSEAAPPAAPRIGQPARTETLLYADGSPAVFARAGAARDALGFPVGPRRSGRHVHDGFQKSDYDEVAELDSNDQPIALTQFDGGGHLLDAVRFDQPAKPPKQATGDSAVAVAQRGLAATGVKVSGRPQADANSTLGGWDVHWDRTQAGLPVRGDETRVHVWQDGRIQSVGRVEHDLASAPARQLGQADARQAVVRQCDKWFAGSDSGYGVQGMDLEWVAPNAAFDESKVGAAPQPYRLAWVANVKPTGPAAQAIQLITLYVDAGDGTVIGGDVVE